MRKILMYIFLLLPLIVFCQNPQQNSEDLYEKARSLADKNAYDEAQNTIRQILAINPVQFDARVLLARIFAWKQQYDSARVELKKVMDAIPSHHDAIDALIDVEYWGKNYYEALTNANQGIYYYPTEKTFLLKKIKILLAMGREEEAREVLAILYKLYPNDPDVRKLMAKLNNYKNRIGLEYTFDFFNKPYKYRWHMSSFQYQRDEKWGSVIGKINAGKAFTHDNYSLIKPDIQIEADAYPILSPNMYLYLNYGYSWGEFFPRHRAGFEPFFVLPRNWEISTGGRLLIYENATGSNINALVLTASVSKYLKSNWLSFRPYYVFIDSKFSQSYLFYYRYYQSAYNYIGGVFGIGNSPDDPSIRSGDVSRLSVDSYMGRFDIQHLIAKRFLIRSFTGLSIEKYEPSKFRPRFDATLYIAFLF